MAFGEAPAGPTDHGSVQRGTRVGVRDRSTVWPTAGRCSSTSSAFVTVCDAPSGFSSRSRSAWSHGMPVSVSMMRPRTTKPALQYDHIVPTGATNGSVAQPAT